MILRDITLINFKNHRELSLNFAAKSNAIVGRNGVGKTAILDAIHYLCLCKSYFNPIDNQQICYNQDFFIINGKFNLSDNQESVSCSVKRNQKKIFKRNQKTYERLADHIGLFPLVVISPNDVNIILDGSDERRRFIDNVISQTDGEYLSTIIEYSRYLLNRNAILKKIAETKRYDPELLELYDEKLIQLGETIFNKRKDFIEEFIKIFSNYYKFLSNNEEPVSLSYSSQLFGIDSFKQLLNNSLEKDRLMERTTCGIHKDDLVFSINEMPLKKFASQGQQKTFLTALKLAQYTYLKQKKNITPILLLDDIFDKLDESRIQKMMQLVSKEDFGQLFITDTEQHRILKVFHEINEPIETFNLDIY